MKNGLPRPVVKSLYKGLNTALHWIHGVSKPHIAEHQGIKKALSSVRAVNYPLYFKNLTLQN